MNFPVSTPGIGEKSGEKKFDFERRNFLRRALYFYIYKLK